MIATSIGAMHAQTKVTHDNELDAPDLVGEAGGVESYDSLASYRASYIVDGCKARIRTYMCVRVRLYNLVFTSGNNITLYFPY